MKIEQNEIKSMIAGEVYKTPELADEYKNLRLAKNQINFDYLAFTSPDSLDELTEAYSEVMQSLMETPADEMLIEQVAIIYNEDLMYREWMNEKNKKKGIETAESTHEEEKEIIRKRIAETIDNEKSEIKFINRLFAEHSVLYAFKNMGIQVPEREAEKIKQIASVHNLDVVLPALKSLQENPTDNMKILKNSKTNLKTSKFFKNLCNTAGILGVTATTAWGTTVISELMSADNNASVIAGVALGLAGLAGTISCFASGKYHSNELNEYGNVSACCTNDLKNRIREIEEANAKKASQMGS